MRFETDYAVVEVKAKGDETQEFVLRHALHQLAKRYKQEYGQDATEALINELRGYHGAQAAAGVPRGREVD